MASQFATKLTEAGLGAKDSLIQDALDTELAEVRKVMDLCDAALAAAEPYVPKDLAIAIRERRQSARALYERLEVK